jgi:hypothetical protein
MARNLIDGRAVTHYHAERMTNCRLRKTREELVRLLAIVEEEIDRRIERGVGAGTK